jgi:hypothetical protein
MNEGLKSGVIPVHHVHADIFDGTADCRSRSAMRLMNRGISQEALGNHELWFEQMLTVELTKPLTGYFELGPPDNYNVTDYSDAIERLEQMSYTVTSCTRFPSDFCGDPIHKDRCYILFSRSPLRINMLESIELETTSFESCLLPLADIDDSLWVTNASNHGTMFVPFRHFSHDGPKYTLKTCLARSSSSITSAMCSILTTMGQRHELYSSVTSAATAKARVCTTYAKGQFPSSPPAASTTNHS